VKILLFGGSQNDAAQGPPFGAGFAFLCAEVTRLTGEPVEAEFRYLFPSGGSERYIARTLDALDPDVVILHCHGVMVGPVTLRPFFRRVERQATAALARRGRRWAGRLIGCDPMWPHPHPRGIRQRAYFCAYNHLLRLGIGGPEMALEPAIRQYTSIIWQLSSHEDTALVVRGGAYHELNRQILRIRAGVTARTVSFNRALADVCQERRVPFVDAWPVMRENLERFPHYDADGAHLTVEGDEAVARLELEALAPLLAR